MKQFYESNQNSLINFYHTSNFKAEIKNEKVLMQKASRKILNTVI